MGFKKIKYNDGEEIFEVKIKNSDGSFLDNWTFKLSDIYNWVDIMEKKFGLSRRKKKKIEMDLEWTR